MGQPTAPSSLPEGSVFHGRYQVVRCIRAGGMGAVYEVIHLETKRRRALKVMLPSIVQNAEMRGRFKLEATVTAEIESEHIVETFDAGIDPETQSPFLVMELLRGEDLSVLLEKRGALGPEETVLYLSQTALALDRTHLAGVVHRDLKPENLFVTVRDDGSPRIKILDFGIAKVVSESAHTAKQTASLGTPLYMSPEQIKGDGGVGPRADLYALGHIAYAMLTGRAYWDDEAENSTGALYGLILKVMQGPQEAPSVRAARQGRSLPPAFDAWFARATAPDPRYRFERASEAIGALAAALGMNPSQPSLAGVPSASARPESTLLAAQRQPAPPSVHVVSAVSGGVETHARTGPSSLGAPGNTMTGRTTIAVASDPPAQAAKSSALPLVLGALGLCSALGLGGWALLHARSPARASDGPGAGAPTAPAVPPPTIAPSASSALEVVSSEPATPPAPPEPIVSAAGSAEKKANPIASGHASVTPKIVAPSAVSSAKATVRKTIE